MSHIIVQIYSMHMHTEKNNDYIYTCIAIKASPLLLSTFICVVNAIINAKKANFYVFNLFLNK